MLKVRNLGSKFISITAGVIDHNEVKDMEIWEIKMLSRIPTYNLQIIMDAQ